jgi:hypothetical protein
LGKAKRANNVPLGSSKNCQIAYENWTSPKRLVEDFGLLFKCLEFAPSFGLALGHLFRREICQIAVHGHRIRAGLPGRNVETKTSTMITSQLIIEVHL